MHIKFLNLSFDQRIDFHLLHQEDGTLITMILSVICHVSREDIFLEEKEVARIFVHPHYNP